MRLYQEKDYKEVLDFMKSVDKDFSPPLDKRDGGIESYLNEILKRKYRGYILEDHKFFIFFPRIIGLLMTFKERESRILKYVAIAENYREKGLAESLLEIFLSDIRKAKEVILRTWSRNERALSLYKKFGFRLFKKMRDEPRPKNDKSVFLRLERNT